MRMFFESTQLRIHYDGDKYLVPACFSARAKGAPEKRWRKASHWWVLTDIGPNRAYLRANFQEREFEDEAWQKSAPPPAAPAVPEITERRFPADPKGLLPHQREGLDRAYGLPHFAFFHDMVSGKSRTLLELWLQYFKERRIHEAWVICPNSLIDNWFEQIDLWAPSIRPYISVWGVGSLQNGSLPEKLRGRVHNTLSIAIDESQTIKNPLSNRADVAAVLGAGSAYNYILTGTSITRGIQDLYSQFAFLGKGIIGFTSYYSFRNHYCLMGGFDKKQIIGYKNMNELLATLAPFTHVVTDPIELPPLTTETRSINLTPIQKRLLKELKSEMRTLLDGNELTVTNVLSLFTRGAQIIGGHFADDTGQLKPLDKNPKLDELREIVQASDKKIVVFTRFVPEAKLIHEAFPGCVRMDPDIEPVQDTVNRFQKDPDVRMIVCTYARGARGFTMTAGKILVRYSSTFNYEELTQAAKRIHRLGQDEPSKLIDLIGNVYLDRHIRDIAATKESLAQYVTETLQHPETLIQLLETAK
jgi:SNF2 family DNA or RNA helicase